MWADIQELVEVPLDSGWSQACTLSCILALDEDILSHVFLCFFYLSLDRLVSCCCCHLVKFYYFHS